MGHWDEPPSFCADLLQVRKGKYRGFTESFYHVLLSLKRGTVSARNITLLIDYCVNYYYCGLLFNIKYRGLFLCQLLIWMGRTAGMWAPEMIGIWWGQPISLGGTPSVPLSLRCELKETGGWGTFETFYWGIYLVFTSLHHHLYEELPLGWRKLKTCLPLPSCLSVPMGY